jgi:DNA polymerase IV
MFLLTLPVGRIPGVGKVMEAHMARAGIKVVGDILAIDRVNLDREFGSYSQRLYELAHGVDHNPVVSNRVRKQISAEDSSRQSELLATASTSLRAFAVRPA